MNMSEFAWCHDYCQSVWLDFRWFLWRHGIPLPARAGWRQLVRDVVKTDGAYVADGVIGAPLAWSLFNADRTPIETMCAITGLRISPTSVPFGVRCARCGVPLVCTAAGMATSVDVPSCKPCHRAVHAAIHEAGGAGGG